LRSILSGEEKVPVVVLTATATPEVEKQIRENLQMNDVTRIVSPPDRPNIRYSVVKMKTDDVDQNFSWLIQELLKQGYSSRRVIIFCKSHASCRNLYRKFHIALKLCNYSSYKDRQFAMFHAGTDDEIKSFIIDSFSKENGMVRVLFATTAFGMGVDCKGLDLVVHYGPPSNVDDYVQESGRAGRDNSKSHAVLVSYPKCTSGKVSKTMKDYIKNNTICRRQMLLQCFDSKTSYEIPKDECCNVCSAANNSSGPCRYLSPFESNANVVLLQTKTTSKSTFLSQEGKSILKKKLMELRNSCMEGICNSVAGPDISTGFPLLAVEQITEKVHLMSNEQSIWKETCILDTKLTSQIFEIIQDVRKHHEACSCHYENGNSSSESEVENSSEVESSESDSNRRYRATFQSPTSDSSASE
jgi:ATP-dependent DNA helicase RecQ